MTFLKRLFSTVLLLFLFGGIIFFPAPWSTYLFIVLALFFSALTPWEITGMLEYSGRKTYRGVAAVILPILAVFMFEFFLTTDFNLRQFYKEVAVIFSLLLLILPWFLLVRSKDLKEGFERVLSSAGVLTLTVPPILLIILLYFMHGPLVFLFFVLMTKIGDIGAYVLGTLSAKITNGHNHKIFPVISPAKSYEGCIGGLIVTVLGSILLYPFTLTEFPMSICGKIILGIILYIGGAAGDLAESVIKRACGVKDSGKILPGIGGVFDLVDSLLMNSLVFWLFLTVYKILK